jgi:hypothetical protein
VSSGKGVRNLYGTDQEKVSGTFIERVRVHQEKVSGTFMERVRVVRASHQMRQAER